jgi:hypothetical protein
VDNRLSRSWRGGWLGNDVKGIWDGRRALGRRPNLPASYGKDNGVVDDFADSFAAYVLNRIGVKTPTIPYDQQRQMIIASWIDITSK